MFNLNNVVFTVNDELIKAFKSEDYKGSEQTKTFFQLSKPNRETVILRLATSTLF